MELRPEVADEFALLLPDVHPPPLGKKILVETWEGCTSVGTWSDGCVAWAPMPRETDEIKRRREWYWREKCGSKT